MLLASCAVALPRAQLEYLKRTAVDDTFMANVSLLQIQERLPKGTMRIQAIDRELNKIEQAVEDALGGGYKHALLVNEDEDQSRAVRVMVPSGHKQQLSHALMLERGWWSDMCDAVVTVVTKVVDVVVETVVRVVKVRRRNETCPLLPRCPFPSPQRPLRC